MINVYFLKIPNKICEERISVSVNYYFFCFLINLYWTGDFKSTSVFILDYLNRKYLLLIRACQLRKTFLKNDVLGWNDQSLVE